MIHLRIKFPSFCSTVTTIMWKTISEFLLPHVAILHCVKQLPVFDRRCMCSNMSTQFLGTCIIEYLLWHDVHLKVHEHWSLGLEDTRIWSYHTCYKRKLDTHHVIHFYRIRFHIILHSVPKSIRRPLPPQM